MEGGARQAMANGSACGRRVRNRQKPGLRAWIQRMIFLFDVTMVPYMLDWWEKIIVRLFVAISMWFVCYKSTQVAMWCYEEFIRKMENSSYS